jgi:hypothetical protein
MKKVITIIFVCFLISIINKISCIYSITNNGEIVFIDVLNQFLTGNVFTMLGIILPINCAIAVNISITLTSIEEKINHKLYDDVINGQKPIGSELNYGIYSGVKKEIKDNILFLIGSFAISITCILLQNILKYSISANELLYYQIFTNTALFSFGILSLYALYEITLKYGLRIPILKKEVK